MVSKREKNCLEGLKSFSEEQVKFSVTAPFINNEEGKSSSQLCFPGGNAPHLSEATMFAVHVFLVASPGREAQLVRA